MSSIPKLWQVQYIIFPNYSTPKDNARTQKFVQSLWLVFAQGSVIKKCTIIFSKHQFNVECITQIANCCVVHIQQSFSKLALGITESQTTDLYDSDQIHELVCSHESGPISLRPISTYNPLRKMCKIPIRQSDGPQQLTSILQTPSEILLGPYRSPSFLYQEQTASPGLTYKIV